MIVQFFGMDAYDWDVCIFYDTDARDADTVIGMLRDYGCHGLTMRRAERNLKRGLVNTGLTYTNPDMRTSVSVIGHTSSARQFWNTFDHEKDHIAEHIAEALGIPFKGEELRYLKGTIAEETFNVARRYICGNFCPKDKDDEQQDNKD